jgi:thymidylate kinase
VSGGAAVAPERERTERRVWVEFLGMPGSGKSTVSHALAGVLRQRGMTVAEPTYATDHLMSDGRRYLYKSGRLAGTVLRGPREAASAFRTVLRTRQRRNTAAVLATVNWLFIASLLERPPIPAAVQVVDEGLFQALWSVCFEAEVDAPAGLLATLARSGPCPDAVVLLEVDATEVKRRLASRSRGMSRMDGSAAAAPESWLRGRRALLETRKVFDALTRPAGRPMVIRLRNDRPEDIPELAERLAARLAPLVRSFESAGRRTAATAAPKSPA